MSENSIPAKGKTCHMAGGNLPKDAKNMIGTKNAVWQVSRLAGTALFFNCYSSQSFPNPKTDMASINVKPLADRVLVEPAAAEETTASGIIIPDTAKEKPQKGTIIAVGNGKKDEPMTVQVGDTILYGKYAGTEITVEGNDYLIMRESDIFAVI